LSSLSEHERIGLEDVFMCLGEKQSVSEKIIEQKSRLLGSLSSIVQKGIPKGISYVKSKKIMFKQRRKVVNFKLFNHFRPKNRDSK
jgi:hypothetical protein